MRSARSIRVLRCSSVLACALCLASLSAGVALVAEAAPPASGAAPALSPSKTTGAPAAKPRAAADGGGRYDPDNVTAISQSMETIVKGNEKYVAKDYVGAIDLFKRAIQLNPRNPLAHYVLGEAYLATNNLGEAEAAFATAAELNDLKDPRSSLVRSHVLFAVADCFEREKKWEQARTAWQAYAEHAAKLGPDGGALPQSAVARLKAIDDALKQDQQYEIVRQRIAAEKADAGAAAPTPAKK